MADTDREALEARVAALEAAQKSVVPRWLRDGMALMSPVLLAVLGFTFNSILQDAKNDIAETQTHIQRIEAAQQIMEAVFDREIAEAKALIFVFRALLGDEEYAESLFAEIDGYFQAKIDRLSQKGQLSEAEIQELSETISSAAAINPDSAVARDGVDPIHVVILSLSTQNSANFPKIVRLAERISEDPSTPSAEVWCSSTAPGYYALTLGQLPPEDVQAAGEAAVAAGFATDFYATRGDRFFRKVWPGTNAFAEAPCS